MRDILLRISRKDAVTTPVTPRSCFPIIVTELSSTASPDESLVRGPNLKACLEVIPCPLAIWSPDAGPCLINERAAELTGYSAEELGQRSSLWAERIHPDDRHVYLNARQRFEEGDTSTSCEYRFLPKGQQREKWLHDASFALPTGNDSGAKIASLYTDISELMTLRQTVDAAGLSLPIVDIVLGLIHEMENNLQVIKGALDLSRLRGVKPTELVLIESGVGRTNKLMRELGELFAERKDEASVSDPGAILNDLIECMKDDFCRSGIRIKRHDRSPIPQVPIEPAQFRRALQAIMELSLLLMAGRGELQIDTVVSEMGSQKCLSLKIALCGAISMPAQEGNLFRPFIKINGQSLGLSMTLAQRTIKRSRGTISFESQTDRGAVFALQLPAISD